MKKNIILFGGSNSVILNGLQKGLREGIEKLNLALEEQSQAHNQNRSESNTSGGGGSNFII